MSKHKSAFALDRTDIRILDSLQQDAHATLTEVAKVAHLSVSQTQRRVRNLEKAGVITRYAAHLDAAGLGLEVLAYVEVALTNQDTGSANRFHKAVNRIPEILECHRVSGDADYLLKIIAPNLIGYSSLAQKKVASIPEVDKLVSKIVFESTKNTTAFPLIYARVPAS